MLHTEKPIYGIYDLLYLICDQRNDQLTKQAFERLYLSPSEKNEFFRNYADRLAKNAIEVCGCSFRGLAQASKTINYKPTTETVKYLRSKITVQGCGEDVWGEFK